MPAKNILKQYVEEGYYHIYNRGVEKRAIFIDNQDTAVFLHYLKLYLSPLTELEKMSRDNPKSRLRRFLIKNLSQEIELLAFSLMPNHIHLLVKQHSKDGITKLMRRLLTSYVMYFNRKYKRIGSLFQSRYKAALVLKDEYLLHLSRYIHLNPLAIKSSLNFNEFSSYHYYLGKKQANWIKPYEILDYFSSNQRVDNKNTLSYQSFVENYSLDDTLELVEDLALEDNL